MGDIILGWKSACRSEQACPARLLEIIIVFQEGLEVINAVSKVFNLGAIRDDQGDSAVLVIQVGSRLEWGLNLAPLI